MNVTSGSALPLVLLLIACCYASPMFGTGGVMKRKFPGATDMSYGTYRGIVSSHSAAAAASGAVAGAGGAGAVPRTGGSSSGDNAWMFGGGLAAPSSATSFNQPGSFTQSGLPFNQQQPFINPQQLPFDQQQQFFNQQQQSINQQQPSFNQQQLPFDQQQQSFNQQQPSFNQQQPSFNQQGLPLYPHDTQDTYQGRYASSWDPRGSFAFLRFPHHVPSHLDYDQVIIPSNKIHNDYY